MRESVASLADVAPTLLDLAGLSAPAHMQGRSMAGTLRGERQATARPYTFFETGKGAGIRSLQHTYFLPWGTEERRLGDAPTWFYDNLADPFQLRPLDQGQGTDLDALLRRWDRATPWMAG